MTKDTITIFKDEMETIEGVLESYRSQNKIQDERIQELTGILELRKASEKLNLFGTQLLKSVESDTKQEIIDSAINVLSNLSSSTPDDIKGKLGDIIDIKGEPEEQTCLTLDNFVKSRGTLYKSY